ncbi:MAG: hypothetical protein QOI63_241 [Thermoplasmata archaeon]|jgi:hypothetical protein|nr:hypothetical protein [Thermoplasmata archaeon]
MKQLIVPGIAVLAMVLATGISRPAVADPSAPQYVDASHLQVGDIIATGTSIDGACNFPGGFGLHIVGDAANPHQGFGLATDAGCNLVVQQISHQPTSITDVALPSVGNYQAESPGLPFTGRSTGNTDLGCPSGGGEVHGYVWMWGYGGPDDRLTIKEGYMTFSYAKCIAWGGDSRGYCHTRESWWKIDGCHVVSQGSDPDKVHREAHGDYHCYLGSYPCSSPGYYHTLADEEEGYPDGSYHCNPWYSGSIVSGVWASCDLSEQSY